MEPCVDRIANPTSISPATANPTLKVTSTPPSLVVSVENATTASASEIPPLEYTPTPSPWLLAGAMSIQGTKYALATANVTEDWLFH